jgi:murein DD-endopeptidase MepM/ murein hydrolase activator NlpD
MGSIIENVYVDNNITVKKTNIPITKTIYTEASELAKFLLFGTTELQKTYIVKPGDTIEEVAFDNKISVEEFLISNPQFSSVHNLLFPGQEVVIGVTNPQIQVVVEEFVIEDVPSRYQTEERYDPNRFKGDDKVIQKGENGLDRITQRTRKINGIITYVDKIASEELKPPINQIIVRGKKEFPSVGSLTVWAWPTERGYKISSPYGYRINPVTGKRELHAAIDIAGPKHGSNIYAANNGVIVEAKYSSSLGNYIVINHNNGYYTLYAHLSKILVEVDQHVARGQVIGLLGNTGRSTGPHLHFGVYVGRPFHGGTAINPLRLYK